MERKELDLDLLKIDILNKILTKLPEKNTLSGFLSYKDNDWIVGYDPVTVVDEETLNEEEIFEDVINQLKKVINVE